MRDNTNADVETLEIFRNCGYEYPLLIQDEFGYPEDLDGYKFVFLIAPTQRDRTFGTPIISNTAPVVSSGLGQITFVLFQSDTSLMQIGTAYHFRVMIEAPDSSPQVVRGGRIKLIDAPVFPI